MLGIAKLKLFCVISKRIGYFSHYFSHYLLNLPVWSGRLDRKEGCPLTALWTSTPYNTRRDGKVKIFFKKFQPAVELLGVGL